MYKTPVICSLLMAFGLSALMVGCEPSKMGPKPGPKPAIPSSTTGGGTEVPKAPKGSAEMPKAAEPAPKVDEAPKTEDAPKADAPKADDAPKAEEAPKSE